MNTIQKPIGVCLSQAHTMLKTELLSELARSAGERGQGIIAFNSSLDYYWSQKGDHITACIYQMIRFEELSALVVLHNNIYDPHLMNYLVANAKQHGLPVFYLGGIRKDCVSITDDYEAAYKALIRHVIEGHGVRDLFYIAGLRHEDNSLRRLQYFRDVLEEYGIPCAEENVAYGNYLDSTAAEIVRELAKARGRVPRAILCANDSMAAAVCEELAALGFRVPEDVIVTGFDGTPSAWLNEPQLSTCGTNPGELADLITDLTDRYLQGETLEKTYTHPYKTLFMESCGCGHLRHPRFSALRAHRQAESFTSHENNLYYSVEQLMQLKDEMEIFRKLSFTLLPDSALYLNRSLLESDPGEEYHSCRIEDELVMVPRFREGEPTLARKVYRKDMPLPGPGLPGMNLLNVIHSDSLVFGYYAVHTTDPAADAQFIKRMSDVMNLYFCILEARSRQSQLIARLENNLYMDSRTGLANLKGITRWFHQYISDPDNHRRHLALSIYAIQRYSWIFETHGLEETERVARIVTNALRTAHPGALIIARLNEDQFAVAESAADAQSLAARTDSASAAFFRLMETESARANRDYRLEVSRGTATLETGWESTSMENLIHLAIGEMYLNRLHTGPRENTAAVTSGPEMYSSLILLLEKDLIQYHYQPIVDARTGQVYAYEALMRSGSWIQLTPLQILSAAREYNRLYDVEKATLFGIIETYVHNYREFNGCKVFINTIPGCFLNEDDCREIMARYGSYLDCFVLELTEDEPATDEELRRMKRLSRPGSEMQVAIDDYGIGHSNIVNLLRYSPQIIKIDRALITGVDKDPNKQLFVRNTIEFAHQNSIRVLAEGVETSRELTAVISLGIDLIQGFYTGRPSPRPVPVIPESVRNEIVQAKLQSVRYGASPLTCTMADGDTADLVRLRLQQINCVRMGSGTYTLTGDPSQCADIVLRVEDDSESVIRLNGVNIRGVTEPTMVLGRGCRVTIILEGENTFRKEGIVVPPDSTLVIRGEGSLHINNNRNYSAGIGARYNDPYGTIILDIQGRITFSSAGDRVVCIGGGRSAGGGIRLVRGTYDMTASGINVVCVGSSLGDADIQIGEASLTARGEGNEVLVLGSVSGRARIVSSGSLRLSAACERATGAGTISGDAEILFEGGSAFVSVSCDSGAVIGTFSGEFTMVSRSTLLRLHGEGNQVVGLGSVMGAGETRIESGEIHGEILAGERRILGNEESRCVITGGNFHLSGDESVAPVSPDGTPLTYLTPKEDRFEQTYSDSRETWTYTAQRNAEGTLGVFVPSP